MDYNKQETINATLHVGQMICGLRVLRKGGYILLKIYSWFSPRLQSLIAYCASHFDKFYIDKPRTSRPENSEVYLIGMGYNPISEEDYQKLLIGLKRVDSLIDLSKIDLTVLRKTLEDIVNRQIIFLN